MSNPLHSISITRTVHAEINGAQVLHSETIRAEAIIIESVPITEAQFVFNLYQELVMRDSIKQSDV